MFDAQIDEALIRIAATAGEGQSARVRLAGLSPDAGPLSYLAKAAAGVADLTDGAIVAVSHDLCLDALWDGRLSRLIEQNAVLRDELGDQLVAEDTSPLDPEHYPDAAREAFAQGLLLAQQDAEVVVLWKRPQGISVHRAHPEGFWQIARDPVHWITQLADALERGASPRLVRSRIERFVEDSGAQSFRLVTAVGEMSDLLEAGESAGIELAARLRAYGEAGPKLQIAMHTIHKEKGRRGPNIRTHKTVFEGDGAALTDAAADLATTVGRGYYELTLRGRGLLAVRDGLSSAKLEDLADEVAEIKRRHGLVVVDVGTAERSISDSTLILVGDLDAKEVKSRLRDLVASSRAKRFDLRVFEGDKVFTSHEGLTQKKLLRMASVLPGELDRGGTVEVTPVGAKTDQRSTPVTPLRL